jgi:hypothetical protein
MKSNFSLRSVVLNWITCVLMLRLLWLFVPYYLSDQNFYWDRLMLKMSVDNRLGFMDIIWRVALTECLVVLGVLAVKVLVVLVAYIPLPMQGAVDRNKYFVGALGSCTAGAARPHSGQTMEHVRYADIETARRESSVPRRTSAVPVAEPVPGGGALTVPSSTDASNLDGISLTSLLSSALGDRFSLAQYGLLSTVGGSTEHSGAVSGRSDAGHVAGSGQGSVEGHAVHFRGQRHHQTSNSSREAQTTSQVESSTHSNNSSDAEDNEMVQHKCRQELNIYFGLRRIFSCLDCCSLLFRTMLPFPLWFVYLHRGSYSSSLFLPVIYVALKLTSVTWICCAVFESATRLFTWQLVRLCSSA